MPPTSVAAANPQLFQELQAMRRQVAELTAMVSEQQRREVEQRQQLEALFQYVRSGSIPLPATTALPAATTSTDAAAAATVAATASAAHASPATVDSEPQRGQRVGRAAASALKETEGSHLAAAAAAATTTTQPPRPLQPPQPLQPLQASKDTAVECASVPVVAAAGVSGTADSAPTEVAPSNTVADGCLGEGSGSSSSSLGEDSSSSSSNSSNNNAFVVSRQMDDKQEEAQGLPVSLAVQPELLALLEQELNVRVGCSGNAALGGSSSSSTDEVKQTAGSDSTTSGRAADGQGRGTDTVVSPLLGNRTIISNAAVEEVSADVQHVDHGVNVTATMMPLLTLPVNGDDVIVTHGSADNVQEELRLLLALELQQAAAPSTAGEVDTSLQDVILGVGFRYDSTTAVPPPPTVTVLPPAASDKAISAVNEQGPQLPAAAGTAAHSPDATVGITTAPQPLSPASAPSVNTASGSGSSSTPMMSLAHDSITTYGDDGSSHSSSSRDSSSAGSSSEVFANESELRDVVGQLMSVASETARLARQAKQVGVALPPELQQPTVLPMALALLQRLRASKASAGSEALGGVPAAPDATAAEAVAVPPSVILPESSVATAPRHSGSGHADEQRRSRSEGRSSGGAVGGGGGAGGRRNLHFVTMRGGRGGGGRGGGGDRGSKEGNGGSKSDRTEPGGRSAVPVAAAAQPVSELTPDQLAALRAHPSYMFEGLRRLSWEGQEPLAAPAPSLSITPSSASAGLETPPAPLLRRPRRSARVETVGGRRRQAPQPGSQ
ncbi:hypothetical protein Vretifemale_12803 [Volvox reticuliferus]|uniref:Uncharacterized protein n=1 Tax=Volvox reticuliferus TaxID=1737510 RepID=A0A8J4CPL7_9CHLO|nr:hypothetical protein Vretifemale_12803 [Volvox reticuliferus]